MIDIDGTTVMWAFGLALLALSGLVSLVWRMHDRRVAKVETDAVADRRHFNEQAAADRKHFSDTADKIFGKIGETQKTMNEFVLKAAETYVAKSDCQRVHNNLE